jgi:hypothetical protein
MTEYEIYVMLDRGYWRVGKDGKQASFPSGFEGSGLGAGAGLETFIKSMMRAVKTATEPEDKVVYKLGPPPWWPQPRFKATEEEVTELIEKYKDIDPEIPKGWKHCPCGF